MKGASIRENPATIGKLILQALDFMRPTSLPKNANHKSNSGRLHESY
jgi:hypothetical protein